MSPGKVSEQETRYSFIDPELKKAGWNLSGRSQVGFEIPVSPSPSKGVGLGEFHDGKPEEGITDYCLYRLNLGFYYNMSEGFHLKGNPDAVLMDRNEAPVKPDWVGARIGLALCYKLK